MLWWTDVEEEIKHTVNVSQTTTKWRIEDHSHIWDFQRDSFKAEGCGSINIHTDVWNDTCRIQHGYSYTSSICRTLCTEHLSDSIVRHLTVRQAQQQVCSVWQLEPSYHKGPPFGWVLWALTAHLSHTCWQWLRGNGKISCPPYRKQGNGGIVAGPQCWLSARCHCHLHTKPWRVIDDHYDECFFPLTNRGIMG